MSETVTPETIDQEFGSETDDQFDADEDAVKKYLDGSLPPELVLQISEMAATLDPLNADTDLTIDEQLEIDKIETYYKAVDVPPASDTEAAAQRSVTDAQHDAVAQQSRDLRSKMARKIALFILGIIVGEGLLVGIALIRAQWQQKTGNAVSRPGVLAAAAGSRAVADSGPITLTADQQTSANNLLTIWGTKPEATHWQQVADFAVKSNMSLQSQFVMMSYIKNWIDADPITWGPTEKGDAVTALVTTASSGHPTDIYPAVAKIQHNGQPLQRAIAADLCEHALAQLLAAAAAKAAT